MVKSSVFPVQAMQCFAPPLNIENSIVVFVCVDQSQLKCVGRKRNQVVCSETQWTIMAKVWLSYRMLELFSYLLLTVFILVLSVSPLWKLFLFAIKYVTIVW